jgi:hypothetical protein
MKHRIQIVSVLTGVLVVAATLAGSGDRQNTKAAQVRYNPATVQTIQGIVTGKVEVPWGASDCWGGEHLLVKTEKEAIQVHVGPTWFLLRHGWRFAEGDHVVITGSRIKVENTEALVAQEVQRGDKKLELRDATGKPVWSAGRK